MGALVWSLRMVDESGGDLSRLSQAGCTTEIGALGISIIEERGAVLTGDSNDDS